MKTSYEFTHAIARLPGNSVVEGIRDIGPGQDSTNPDVAQFRAQHRAYLDALTLAGVEVTPLDASEAYPDSVFVEDAALCLGNSAIVLRPGAPSRAGEAALIKPALLDMFDHVVELQGEGTVDGGDVLVAENLVFVGRSARTSASGLSALTDILATFGYQTREVQTPETILHFKSACGLLDDQTIFADRALSETGCFEGFNVIHAPAGEEAATNLIRVNDRVLVSRGFPRTVAMLEQRGYKVIDLDCSEAARIDGGLSCMSLRFNLAFSPGV